MAKMAKEQKTQSLRVANMHIPSHILMVIWTFIAGFPVYLLIINSLKTKKAIYDNPFGIPSPWTLENYKNVVQGANFFHYFGNSATVVVVSLFMILLLGSLAAYALAHWRGRFSHAIYFFFLLGMMLPIKIATIRLMELMKVLSLFNTLWCLFLVYTAMGLPTCVFILTEFIHGLPQDLYEAAYIDGADRLRRLLHITLPGIQTTISVMLILEVGNLLSVSFDQIFILINDMVLETGETLDYFVYRVGLNSANNFSQATATGLIKSTVGFILILTTNLITKRMTEGEGGIW